MAARSTPQAPYCVWLVASLPALTPTAAAAQKTAASEKRPDFILSELPQGGWSPPNIGRGSTIESARLFQVIEGLSLRGIARRLNKEGVKTSRDGWMPSVVKRMLNPLDRSASA